MVVPINQVMRTTTDGVDCNISNVRVCLNLFLVAIVVDLVSFFICLFLFAARPPFSCAASPKEKAKTNKMAVFQINEMPRNDFEVYSPRPRSRNLHSRGVHIYFYFFFFFHFICHFFYLFLFDFDSFCYYFSFSEEVSPHSSG